MRDYIIKDGTRFWTGKGWSPTEAGMKVFISKTDACNELEKIGKGIVIANYCYADERIVCS